MALGHSFSNISFPSSALNHVVELTMGGKGGRGKGVRGRGGSLIFRFFPDLWNLLTPLCLLNLKNSVLCEIFVLFLTLFVYELLLV